MTRKRLVLALAAPLLALPVPAAAQDVCALLDRIAAASREPVPFASLQRALDTGAAVVPDFAPRHCATTPGSFYCSVRDMSPYRYSGWPDPLRCPGWTPAVPGPSSRSDHWARAYERQGLRVEYGANCQVCRGGAYSFFSARRRGWRGVR